MRFTSIFVLLFVLWSKLIHAQAKVEALYDTDLLSKQFHEKRRQALREKMPDSSCCIFFAATSKIKSNDIEYEFHQSPNFYYLTGLQESNAIVIIFKNSTRIDSFETNELLFINDKDDGSTNKWNENTYSLSEANSKLGIKTLSNITFNKIKFNKLPISSIYIDDTYLKEYSLTSNDIAKSIREVMLINTQLYSTNNINEWLAELRQIKQPEELILMRKAIDITCQGFNEMIKAVTKSTTEYQAEGMVEYMFKKAGAEDVGYPSICGGGENSTVLHYSTNRRKTITGDLLLVDAGAQYHGYSADVTRTLSVNGKFTKDQVLLYNLVLKAQDAAIEQCKSGNSFYDPHFTACKILKEGLKELGIIKNEIDYKKYYWHGTSHYLGLDVHDAGTYERLTPNTVITVEPGIYIKAGSDCDKKWWNIGIRIEDDILITAEQPIILSSKTPRRLEDIELLMKQKSFFNYENK